MTAHSPGKMIRKPDLTWQVICVCGDPWCAEDWDYEGVYVMHVPPGLTREDLPIIKEVSPDDRRQR